MKKNLKKTTKIILFFFIYLNFGSYYINELVKARYEYIAKGHLSVWTPIYGGEAYSFKERSEIKLFLSKEKYAKKAFDKDLLSSLWKVIIWPFPFIFITARQWILVAIKFIFLGGLIQFVLKNNDAILIASGVALLVTYMLHPYAKK